MTDLISKNKKELDKSTTEFIKRFENAVQEYEQRKLLDIAPFLDEHATIAVNTPLSEHRSLVAEARSDLRTHIMINSHLHNK